MHKLIADPQIAQVRKRASEGDCPITPSLSVESLEDLVLHLADAKKEDQSAKINRDAFAAVQVVVRAAWRLVDNTANGGTEHQAVPGEDWLELAHTLARLNEMIPPGERPAEPPHTVALFWPTARESGAEGGVISEALSHTTDDAALAHARKLWPLSEASDQEDDRYRRALHYAFARGAWWATSTPNDEAGIKPAPPPSTSNDE